MNPLGCTSTAISGSRAGQHFCKVFHSRGLMDVHAGLAIVLCVSVHPFNIATPLALNVNSSTAVHVDSMIITLCDLVSVIWLCKLLCHETTSVCR